MSNQKFYTDAGGNVIWVPQMGSIWHVRGNELLHDYGDTRTSEEDYGAGLAEALGASGPTTLQPGDTVVVGPGTFRTVSQIVCAVGSVRLVFYDTKLGPSLATASYESLLRFNATDDLFLSGLSTFDDRSTITAGEGAGVLLSLCNRAVVQRCFGKDHQGGITRDTPAGYSLWISGGSDVTIDNCYAEGCQYTGLRLVNSNRLRITNTRLYNNGTGATQKRCMQFDGSSDLDLITIDNCYCLAEKSDAGALINMAMQSGGSPTTIQRVEILNTRIVNDDQLAAGISYDTINREQCLKLGSLNVVKNLLLDNVEFKHGANFSSANPGQGFVTGFAIDHGDMDSLIVRNCRFSDGFQTASDYRVEHAVFENCQIGVDRVETASAPIGRLWNGRIYFRGCSFNVHDKIRCIAQFSPSAPQADDILEFSNCRFISARSTGHSNICDDVDPPTLIANQRKVICYDNTYFNSDATWDFRPSNWDVGAFGKPEANLLLSTDSAGQMLFDENRIGTGAGQGMPDPGTGPSYFTDGDVLPGYDGQIIRNITWKDNGTGVRGERAWIYTGDEWREFRDNLPSAGEMYMSPASDTQAITTTAIAIDVMDTTDVADGIAVSPSTAELTITEPGRYLFYFFANIESSLGKSAVFVDFRLDGAILDTPFRGYTRDSGESITIAVQSMSDITQSDLGDSGGDLILQAVIYAESGTPVITYYNCTLGGFRM